LTKIKEKFDTLLEGENLTFLGKIYFISGVGAVITAVIIAAIEIFEGLLNFILKMCKVVTSFNLGGEWVFVVMFLVFLASLLVITVFEITAMSEGESIITKED